jgi:hypothetical protein
MLMVGVGVMLAVGGTCITVTGPWVVGLRFFPQASGQRAPQARIKTADNFFILIPFFVIGMREFYLRHLSCGNDLNPNTAQTTRHTNFAAWTMKSVNSSNTAQGSFSYNTLHYLSFVLIPTIICLLPPNAVRFA